MADVLHAFDFLQQPKAAAGQRIIVAFGDDRFVKRLVLKQLQSSLSDDETNISSFSDAMTQWRDVVDELSTLSLFGTGSRVVVVQEADEFVKNHRGQLENYVDRPKDTGILILDVQSWPGNTRLFKLVNNSGLAIECRAPERTFGRSKKKSLDRGRLCRWLEGWSEQRHGRSLGKGAAEQLLELVGPELGILDQELAKLALFVEPNEKITPQLVCQVVGGWRTQTTWELLDAAVAGDAADAIRQLDQLLQSGEPPQALFGAVAWSLRRFAAAVRVIQQQQSGGGRMSMKQALETAGFPKWPQGALEKAEQQLRQISRQRGTQLYQQLLATDLALKGTHSAPDRARWAMERLILWLSSEARPRVA